MFDFNSTKRQKEKRELIELSKGKNMNNHKNYNSGFRKELLTISLACGFVPFKCLPLLNPNKTSMQHIVNVFVEDGDFEKYHNKEIWIISPTRQTRDRINDNDPNTKDAIGKKFSEELKNYYRNYALSDCYKAKSSGKKYESRRLRSLRNAEVFTFFYSVDFDVLPGVKKTLEELTTKEDLKKATFFPFRELTGINPNITFNDSTYEEVLEVARIRSKDTEKKKEISEEKRRATTEAINLTKINGIVTLPDSQSTYTLINTGKLLDPYRETGELKTLNYVNNILATTSLPQISGCILLYPSEVPIKKMLFPNLERNELNKVRSLFRAYNETNLYAIPLSPEGQVLIKIMNTPSWEERLNSMTIKKEWRTDNNPNVNFDGKNFDEDKKKTCYHFNFLIPDIARLSRYISFANGAIDIGNTEYYIYCYDFQKNFLEEVVPYFVELRTIPLNAIKERFKKAHPSLFREK